MRLQWDRAVTNCGAGGVFSIWERLDVLAHQCAGFRVSRGHKQRPRLGVSNPGTVELVYARVGVGGQ